MKKEPWTKKENPARKTLILGITIAILFWFLDASVDAYLLNERGFVESIFTPEITEVWMRILIMGLIIALSIYSRKHIIELEEMKAELNKLATTDKLTQAYSRAKFEDIIALEIERAKRFNHPLSMLMFDIDDFKKVNDTFGHAYGDYVLKSIADIVRGHTRRINHLIRWGGDEFIIVPVETNLEGARLLSERLRSAVDSFSFDKAGNITASFGVAQLQDDDTEDALLKRMDDALYNAKKSGGNRVETGASI
jgi:diguanylate cyclase (GGDEF)-like protein